MVEEKDFDIRLLKMCDDIAKEIGVKIIFVIERLALAKLAEIEAKKELAGKHSMPTMGLLEFTPGLTNKQFFDSWKNDILRKGKPDIVETISQYVKLEKTGKTFRGLCPFHKEVKPSFFVYPEQQEWRCFGACNTGGDVVDFMKMIERKGGVK